jgi:hypothetical protein
VAVQNLGGILTGSSVDVGTGPVLILLALAFWPAVGAPRPPDRQARAAAAAAAEGLPVDPPAAQELSA